MAHNGGEKTREEAIQKLRELMKDTKFCMFTTVCADGQLTSRPMALQGSEFEGTLWFLTGKSTEKSHEIERERHVNVSFANPDDNAFVSISGRAQLVDDRKKAEQFWSPLYRTWFPKGLDDPDLVLIKVDVDRAEYWDSPNGVVTYLIGAAKAMVTGQRPTKVGDHEELQLH